MAADGDISRGLPALVLETGCWQLDKVKTMHVMAPSQIRRSSPGGRNMELASCGPWRDMRTPVRAIAARYDWNGASARRKALCMSDMNDLDKHPSSVT